MPLITCRKCQTRVEDKSIVVFGFNYHPNCFCCFDCNKLLSDCYFEIDRLPYCELDYKKPRPGGPVTQVRLQRKSFSPLSSSSSNIKPLTNTTSTAKSFNSSSSTTSPSNNVSPLTSSPVSIRNNNNRYSVPLRKDSNLTGSTTSLTKTPPMSMGMFIDQNNDFNKSKHDQEEKEKQEREERQRKEKRDREEREKLEQIKLLESIKDVRIEQQQQQQQYIQQQPAVVTFSVNVEMDDMSQALQSSFYPTGQQVLVNKRNSNTFGPPSSNTSSNTSSPSSTHINKQETSTESVVLVKKEQEVPSYTATITEIESPKPNQITKSMSGNKVSITTVNSGTSQPLVARQTSFNSQSSSSSSSSTTPSTSYNSLNNNYGLPPPVKDASLSLQHMHPYQLTKGNSIGSGGNGEGLKTYTKSYVNNDLSVTSGVPTESYPCYKCHQEIWGKIVLNAVGDQFHPACFSCYICKQSLDNGYFTDENGYLCASCQILLNDRNRGIRNSNGHCSTCYKRFGQNEGHISIDKEMYHHKCFKCCICKTVIKDQNYSRDSVTSTMSNYCCAPCLNSGRADRCPECKEAIVGGSSIFALGKTYHPRCFKCYECHAPIHHGSKFSNDLNKNPTCLKCRPN